MAKKVKLKKVDLAKGLQHWESAPNKGKRFTKADRVYIATRVEKLRPHGYNVYRVSLIIAGEMGRSIDSIRWQVHSPKLWPKMLPKQLALDRLNGDSDVTVGTVSVERYWAQIKKLQRRIAQLERKVEQLIRGRR